MVKNPLYKKIINELSREIGNGTLKVGDKIPTVKEQCQRFGVSHITVLHACDELEKAGLITAQGRRYVVASKTNDPKRRMKNCLGLLIRPLWPYNGKDIYFNEINYGIQDECCVHGISYLTPASVRSLNYYDYLNAISEPDLQRDALAMADKVDAFLVDERLSDSFIENLMKRTGKVCIVVNRTTSLPIDAVAPANEQMVNLLCSTALRYGYTKFVFAVSVYQGASSNTLDRYEGILKFIRNNKLKESDYLFIRDTMLLQHAAALEEVDHACKEFGAHEKIAFIATNDSFARDIVTHFQNKGVSFCKNIGVAGMDGMLIAGKSPLLATVRTDTEALGRLAVKAFLNRMINESDPAQLYSPEPVFVYGETL